MSAKDILASTVMLGGMLQPYGSSRGEVEPRQKTGLSKAAKRKNKMIKNSKRRNRKK